MTTVRLVGAIAQGAGGFMQHALTTPSAAASVTTIRLVGARQSNKDIAAALAPSPGGRPAVLVSYAYWKQFASYKDRIDIRDYSLDSGAFTVEHSGGTVDLGAYIAFCQQLLATDPLCAEVFALDVISDWRKSQKNTERMWKAGVPAIPVYHRGEPEALLRDLARSYPKIGLGGCSQLRGPEKLRWAQQCFARAWPARIHGLAIASPDILRALPFHSVDASSWEQGPAAFGNYRSMGRATRAPRGKQINLRAEVDWHLRLEHELQARWRPVLEKLERDLVTRPWPLRKAA